MTSGKSNYKEVLKKAKTDTRKRLDKALQKTILDVMGRMIDRTPVDTGAAKYHWFIRVVPNEKFDKAKVDPSGEQPKQRAKRDVKQPALFGTVIWLLNSAPYFRYLENGSSDQAPSGVIGIAFMEAQLLFPKNAKLYFATHFVD